jgi:hypothetical protein
MRIASTRFDHLSDASILKPCAQSLRLCTFTGRKIMLYTIAVILLIMWLLGMVSAYTIGGFIHILLVIAIVMILVRVIRGERL